jgi:hypothetical protein
MELIIVDNPHPEYGSSVRMLEEQVMPLSGNELPNVTLLPQAFNTGFSPGCNVGIQWAIDHGCDYIFLHSQDGFLAPKALETMVEALESDKTIGAAQALLLLHPETELVNSAGNAYHYLGFGYCNQFRAKRESLNLPPILDSGYASGAALLMRADLVKAHGALDNEFFLYHDDIAYALRLKILGYRVVLVRDAVFYHKYLFGRSAKKLYYIERNRFGMMLMFYRWRTLFLILPMILFLELGLLFFYARQKELKTKMSVYGYWLWPSHWRMWLQKRKIIQAMRKVSDAVLLKDAVTQIVFDDPSINHPLLVKIGNPLMDRYGQWMKRFMTW